MNADGSGQTNLTQNAARDTGPAWQTLGLPPSADARVAITAPASVKTRSTMTLVITVSNAGPDTAEDVVMQTPLPFGTQFESVTSSQGTCVTPSKGGQGTVRCSLGTLHKDASAPATLALKVTAGPNKGTINTIARVSASTSDPVASNNTAAEATQVTK